MDATTVKATTSVLSVIATFAVVGRFWARRLKKQRYGADDWLILCSLAVMWALYGVVLRGVITGWYNSGELDMACGGLDPTHDGPAVPCSTAHGDTTSPRKEVRTSKYNTVKCFLLVAGMGLVKLSVVFLYRRTFQIVRSFHIYSCGLIVLLICWTIAFVLSYMLQCHAAPLTQLWKSTTNTLAFCKDTLPIAYTFSSTDIATDLLVLISPIPVIWKMRVSIQMRIAITAIFGLGFLSTAAAAARMYTFIQTVKNEQSQFRLECLLAIWAVTELTVAILAACLPVMRPLCQAECYEVAVTSAWLMCPFRSKNKDTSKGSQWVEIQTV